MPIRSTFFDVLKDDTKTSHISDKTMKLLQQKTSNAILFWEESDIRDEAKLKEATSLYGGTATEDFASSEEVIVVLKNIRKHIEHMLDLREPRPADA